MPGAAKQIEVRGPERLPVGGHNCRVRSGDKPSLWIRADFDIMSSGHMKSKKDEGLLVTSRIWAEMLCLPLLPIAALSPRSLKLSWGSRIAMTPPPRVTSFPCRSNLVLRRKMRSCRMLKGSSPSENVRFSKNCRLDMKPQDGVVIADKLECRCLAKHSCEIVGRPAVFRGLVVVKPVEGKVVAREGVEVLVLLKIVINAGCANVIERFQLSIDMLSYVIGVVIVETHVEGEEVEW